MYFGAAVVEGLQAGAASASAGVSAVVAAGRASVLAISGVGFSPAVRYFCHVRLQDGTAGRAKVTVMLIVAIVTSTSMCEAMIWRRPMLYRRNETK